MTTNNTKGAKMEKELLRMLEARSPMWPFDEAIDTAYVRKLHALYGAEINLVEKFYLWESYYSGKPARERTNPRLAFHKWCINGVALKKKYAAGAGAPLKGIPGADCKSIPRLPLKPARPNAASAHASVSCDRAADYVAPITGTVNALAAGIVAAKAPGRGDTLVAHGGRSAAATPARKQLTQEELEANRQRQLTEYRKNQEGKNAK